MLSTFFLRYEKTEKNLPRDKPEEYFYAKISIILRWSYLKLNDFANYKFN